MWKHNLIVALRVLWRSRLVSVISVVGLVVAAAIERRRAEPCTHAPH